LSSQASSVVSARASFAASCAAIASPGIAARRSFVDNGFDSDKAPMR